MLTGGNSPNLSARSHLSRRGIPDAGPNVESRSNRVISSASVTSSEGDTSSCNDEAAEPLCGAESSVCLDEAGDVAAALSFLFCALSEPSKEEAGDLVLSATKSVER